MTTLNVLLHGNPGQGDDWRLVVEALGDELVETPSRPAGGVGSLDQLLGPLDRLVAERAPKRLRLIGYSWGCYHAVQYVQRAQRRPDELVLVNPYLVVDNPIGGGAAVILNLPLIGGAILRSKTKTLTPEFIANTFAPAEPPAPVASEMRERLANPELWKGAVAYKLLMQNNPLPGAPALPERTVVVRGAEDRVASWDAQRAVLSGAGGTFHEQVIDGAGHGLPWTHASDIAATIRGDQ